jgi:mannose-1-phosphate guanylyltransferase / mannose-6-phosphate isomerase
VKVLILAGGAGTRLWPLSRALFPKQCVAFEGELTLLQNTIKRVLDFVSPEEIFIVLSEKLQDRILCDITPLHVPQDNIIIEPSAKNTMPAITFSMKWLCDKGFIADHEPLFICPADHWISHDDKEWRHTVLNAATLAELGNIVTFGIVPTHPDTGYGYICADKEQKVSSAYKVKHFVEKPNITTAQRLIEEKGYYWNSGMFIFSPQTFSGEIKRHAHEFYKFFHDKETDIGSAFASLTPAPIDKALMEKSSKIVVQPFSLPWSDVGCWERIHETLPKDENENISYGDVVMQETSSSVIYAQSRLVATAHVKDLIVIETEDAVLVTRQGESQEGIKKLVSSLACKGREEITSFSTSYRPWGYYTVLNEGEGYQVKKIVVSPGKRLSLQMHNKRDEHWTIVQGTALVTLGEEERELYANQSLFIPCREKHRVENKGSLPLEIIETQYGEYLAEDDIVRFQDDFGRVKERPQEGKEELRVSLMGASAAECASTDLLQKSNV